MKQTLVALLLGVLLLLGACTLNTEEEKKEFSLDTTIILERYGMFTMADYAFQTITITKEGILYETYNYNKTKTGEAFTPHTEEEFRALLKVFEDEGFSSLDEKFESAVPVADVGDGVITLQDGTFSHKVEVSPFISQGNPEQIAQIIEALQDYLQDAKFPQREVEMKYLGKQCEQEAWESWYAEGGIVYIQAPSQEQLIKDYYASLGFEILSVETHETGPTCKACGICDDSEYFTIKVTEGISELESEGWEIIN